MLTKFLSSVVLYKMYGFNIVDALVILALILYVFFHVRSGVIALTERLVSLIGALVLSFLTYGFLSSLITKYFNLPLGLNDVIAFVALFFLFQYLIHKILDIIFSKLPLSAHDSWWSKTLAVIPATIDGLILISLTLLLLLVVPFLGFIKAPIEESRLGKPLADRATFIETYVDQVFGQAAQQSLGFLTVEPNEGESVDIPFTPTSLTVDEASELAMLKLVNIERAKVGAPALVMDVKIVAVARAHSKDMWVRQYFAHETPDGLSPFDRMKAGGVVFGAAGENLALARTVVRAHDGLMNSPGHKRNILDPSYRRVGIGVIDGGLYGKMFTQDFAD